MTIDEFRQSKLPHEIAHVICLKCYKRWMAVYPEGTLLADIECPRCREIGYVIKTGQTLPNISSCDNCKLCVNGYCKIGLSKMFAPCAFMKEKEKK